MTHELRPASVLVRSSPQPQLHESTPALSRSLRRVVGRGTPHATLVNEAFRAVASPVWHNLESRDFPVLGALCDCVVIVT